MKFIKIKKFQLSKIRLFTFFIFIFSIQLCVTSSAFATTDDKKKEISSYIEQIFQ